MTENKSYAPQKGSEPFELEREQREVTTSRQPLNGPVDDARFVARSKLLRRFFLTTVGIVLMGMLAPECSNRGTTPEKDTAAETVDGGNTGSAQIEVESEIPAARRIEFMGSRVILKEGKEAEWEQTLEGLRSDLYLRFSTRRNVPEDTTHPDGEERNDEYWERAIEEDFYGALVRAEEYYPLIQEVSQLYNVPENVLAIYFIESGLEPGKRSSGGYRGIPQMNEKSVGTCRRIIEGERRAAAKALVLESRPEGGRTRPTDAKAADKWDEQMEEDIEDIFESGKLGRSPAIPKKDWEEYLNDPWYALHNGAIYFRWLRERLPEDNSIKTYLRDNWPTSLLTLRGKPGLASIKEVERLEEIEALLGITDQERENVADLLGVPEEQRKGRTKRGRELRWRMQYVVERLFEDFEGNDLHFQDPWGFTVLSYNAGPADVARLICMNLVDAKKRAINDPSNLEDISQFATTERKSIDTSEGQISSAAMVDFDMSFEIRPADKTNGKPEERAEYYPLTLMADQILDEWLSMDFDGALGIEYRTQIIDDSGETQTIPRMYSLVKPAPSLKSEMELVDRR